MNEESNLMAQADQKYYANLQVNSPMQQYGGSILQLTNPENEIQKIVLRLRGKMIGSDGSEIKISEPLCNEQGIQELIALLEGSAMNQDIIMTDFEKKDIENMMELIGDSLIQLLGFNKLRYEIPNDTVRTKIFTIIMCSAKATLHRAAMGGERRFWKGSQQEITTRVEGSGSQKKGIASRLFGWGG